MKKLHWVIQQKLFRDNEWNAIISTLERFNMPYSVHEVIPFVGQLEPALDIDQKNVVCLGSYSMRHVAREHGWIPGVYDIFHQNFSVQLEHWGDMLLNYDSDVMKFKDVPELSRPTFIRPIDDSKYFTGKVFDPVDFNTWKHRVVNLGYDYDNRLTGETYVQVCRPKTIFAEYRLWVVDQQIVSMSMYRRGNRIIYDKNVDKHVLEFGNKVLRTKNRQTDISLSIINDGWRPHDAFVLDVCETDSGMKIVEINTLNAAGFYDGNIQDIMMAIDDMEKSRNLDTETY